MPLSAKERAKRFRDKIKLDKSKHEQYLEKEKERWRKRTDEGKIQTIEKLSDRGKHKKRREWRKSQRACYRRRTENKKLEESLKLNSPPNSPQDQINNQQNNSGRRRIHHRNRSATVRQLAKTEKKLKEQATLVERYKKRLNRLKSTEKKKILETDSPRTKTNKLLANTSSSNSSTKVRRTLIFHHALLEELKLKKYENRKGKKSKLMTGKILAKYKLLDEARKELKLSRRQLNTETSDTGSKKRGNPGVPKIYQTVVFNFYERDDVSRIKPGKKDTRTKNKQKKQIRLLTDTLENLYKKCLSENLYMKLSYNSFCKLRPFYVLTPTLKDRDTCLCKRHDNAQFLIEKLSNLKIISSDIGNVSNFVNSLCCDVDDKYKCMVGFCCDCKTKQIYVEDRRILESETSWYQWVNCSKTIKAKTGEDKQIKIIKKDVINGTIGDLIRCLEETLADLCIHVYNIGHQYKQSKKLKCKCSNNPRSAIIHIDFSENWESKYNQEIQSVHFGGSHVQVTLHTGVLYVLDQCISFCTISDSTRHDPAAIWAYLDPVLAFINLHYPEVKNLHFQSDGPSTQYKNKSNFFLLSNIPFDKNFHFVSWDFWESGHGKGAPDGVGAVIKRSADSLVSQGSDIPNAECLFEALTSKNVNIKLFYVDSRSALKFDDLVPKSLIPVKGTMKIRQIISVEKNELMVRNLSCYCGDVSDPCQCYGPQSVVVCAPSLELDRSKVSTISKIADDSENHQSHLSPPGPGSLPEDLVGEWCVVDYDNKPFLGKVIQADEDGVEVSTLQPIGSNKFVWPAFKDVIWYEYSKIKTLINAPERISSRRELYQVPKLIWAELASMFELYD